ncbi:MAG: hypothetical protein KDK64_03300 [Chlamydiia bacterium]|nr:hypothetical protein [Chlamydiia bacterium]
MERVLTEKYFNPVTLQTYEFNRRPEGIDFSVKDRNQKLTYQVTIGEAGALLHERVAAKATNPTESIERTFALAVAAAKQAVEHEPALLSSLADPVQLTLPKDPVVTNCGHLFERAVIQQERTRVNGCPICRTQVYNLTPVHILKKHIEEVCTSDAVIPHFGLFQKDNADLARLHSQIAQVHAEDGRPADAIEAYKAAFKYTKDLTLYANVPPLYLAMREPEKARLAALHLAYYAFQAGEFQLAIDQLEPYRNAVPELFNLTLSLYLLEGRPQEMYNLLAETHKLESVGQRGLRHAPPSENLVKELMRPLEAQFLAFHKNKTRGTLSEIERQMQVLKDLLIRTKGTTDKTVYTVYDQRLTAAKQQVLGG